MAATVRSPRVSAAIAVDRDGGRGGVADIQRARMVAAMAEVVRERGVGQATVAHVVARSGVSRRTFYELFADRDDCFRAALELAVARAGERVVPVYRATEGWRGQMRAGLAALLEFVEDEPDLSALCVVDALGAGPRALEDRARVVAVLIDAVDAGRVHARGSLRPTRVTAEGVVGALLAVLHARLVEGDFDDAPSRARPPLRSLLGALMATVVLPYLGPAAAAREAAKPAPARSGSTHSFGDPLRDLEMRLTYRTVRVLLAIAANPGASNRRVADIAEVADQGQISKLLTRLEHLGLIVNACRTPARGEPNAWSLTPRGEEVEHAINRQMSVAERTAA
jgi:AcrR family transcriptional regulator/DNA-binding MarR family transcriptional regulator